MAFLTGVVATAALVVDVDAKAWRGTDAVIRAAVVSVAECGGAT